MDYLEDNESRYITLHFTNNNVTETTRVGTST